MEIRSIEGVVNSCSEAPVKLSRLKGKVYCMNLKWKWSQWFVNMNWMSYSCFPFSLFHSVSDILAFVILSSLKKIDTVFKVTLFYFIIKITW